MNMLKSRHWCFLVALAAILPLSSALAQSDPPAEVVAPPPVVPDGYKTPTATLLTFVEAMGQTPPDTATGVQCLDLTGVPREAGPDLAIKLYRCINRIELINFDRLDEPGEGEATWTFFPREGRSLPRSHRDRYEEVQRLAPDGKIEFAVQADGAWRFSSATVGGIEDLYERIGTLSLVDESIAAEYRTISEVIESFWPSYFVTNAFLRIKYWQWITLGALIFLGVLLDFTVRFILINVSKRMIERRGGEAKGDSLKRTVRPFGLAAAALLWLFVITFLGLPLAALAILIPAAKFFAILAIVYAAYRVTDLVAEVLAQKAELTDSKFDDLLIPLVRKSVKILITVFGFIYLADSLNVPLGPLLAGIGIGGVGFAFAAKDTLEHFFGSLTVIADRPFQVGDWVVIGDTEGTVESVGFRSTRVRTFYNSLVSIPNGTLVCAVVDNYGLRKYRRWSTHLGLTYDTPPEKIEAFCEGIRELIRLHPYTRKDYYQVWMHQFSAASLDVLVYVFWESPDWNTELRERHRMCLDLLRLADRLGVEFAFPTQTLHIHTEEGGGTHTPATLPPKAVEAKARAQGRTLAHEITGNADWRDGKPNKYVFRGASVDGVDPGDETQIESTAGGDAGE